MTPNTRLCPCPKCAGLVDIAGQRCPHCDEALVDAAGSKLGAAAVLWATLALTACPTEDLYGVPDTISSSESPATAGKTTGEQSTGEVTDGGSTTAPTTGTTGTTEATGTTDATGTSGGTG